jgi:hypothetical protein
MDFPRCSWWCPHVWCSLEEVEGLRWRSPLSKLWGIVVGIVVDAIAFVVCKGKP